MTQSEWDNLVAALNDYDDVDEAVSAADRLHRQATLEDVPRLRELLRGDIFVCEAAAWPLSDLGITDAIPDLLEAMHRGMREGHDHDGMAAAVADLAITHPRAVGIILNQILASDRHHLHALARWLIEFCRTEGSA